MLFLPLVFNAAAWQPAAKVVEKSQMGAVHGWKVRHSVVGSEMHEIVFAIKQRNLELLEQTLTDVSTPNSPKHGKYLTFDEAHALTSNPDGERALTGWLLRNDVELTKLHRHGHYVHAVANVTKWADLLSTKFAHVYHAETGRQLLRAIADVHLPADLAPSVEGLFYTTQMPPRPRPRAEFRLKQESTTVESSTGSITPSLLRSFYNVGDATGSADVSQAVFESLGQYFSPSDLSSFQSHFSLEANAVDTDLGGHSSDSICSSSPNSCGEANLDVQYMLALSPAAPTTYWYESNQATPFESWIEAVASTSSPPLVHSISYGAVEDELSSSITATFNTEAMKLGAQGVSIFVSSGDDGVANFPARSSASQCSYSPSFPASSPYVTAVGATQGVETQGTEVACSHDTGGLITTGGGFSGAYSAPSYQSSAISSYLATVAPTPASGFASGGRGYPDVSMSGHNYEVYIGGQIYQVSGTSASAPVVAAMASLVNAARAAQNKGPIGFINPTLYAAGSQAFNDVTQGGNFCTAGSVCCSQGFTATEGWDPVTGLGSVDFAKFSALF